MNQLIYKPQSVKGSHDYDNLVSLKLITQSITLQRAFFPELRRSSCMVPLTEAIEQSSISWFKKLQNCYSVVFKVETLALFKLEQFGNFKLPTYVTKTLYSTTLSLKLGNFLNTYLNMTSLQLVCFYFLLVKASGVVDCYPTATASEQVYQHV